MTKIDVTYARECKKLTIQSQTISINGISASVAAAKQYEVF